ncbi:ABC transporter ATP-binding protein [Ruminococcus sp.]|uniref:ABC transporter ATP-binding protein n=1 Tax=Ruminococcus sp. TaxID=41978 RepID=UPI0025F22267|nr:ABC transporter ATP-binding protein [Ruminococcus sp.]MBR1431997.1 ABC transporter ATP-binding protein [Ruminococcus sp.]
MSTILKAINVKKSYAVDSRTQEVLKGVDFQIEKGDFAVIMGSSGAGKSTLLYALSGMDNIDSGKIVFGDQSIENYSADKMSVFRRKHCGFVFQQNNLLDNMSILDNVAAAGMLCTSSKKEVLSKAEKLFEKVNISKEIQKKFPSQISGGEAQRAGIVRALINDPDVVFADEPTGSLDYSNGQVVLDLLTDIHKSGQTIIMVTHDIRSAFRGNKVIFVRDGMTGGICELGEYDEKDEERKEKLRSFLEERGW